MNTKTILAASLAAVFTVSMIFAGTTLPAQAGQGNGAPSGPHYNLNLIGKDKTDILPDDSNNGHRIFVNYDRNGVTKNTKIVLQEGPFGVIDADGTDGQAKFQLPAPNSDPASVDCTIEPCSTDYTVWVRVVGKPGGSGTITTCATSAGADAILGTADDVEECSLNVLSLTGHNGKVLKFQNVTPYLTQVAVDTDGDGTADTFVDIFDTAFEDYFWSYDNSGLKIVQLRFYPTA